MSEEITLLQQFYDLVREYRIEIVFTSMIAINPLITYIITQQFKTTAQSWAKRGLKRWEVRLSAFVFSFAINFPIGIRWGTLHWIDAMIIGFLVAGLTPWLVKMMMESTKDSKRWGWIYRSISIERRVRHESPPGGVERRDGHVVQFDDQDTYFGGK